MPAELKQIPLANLEPHPDNPRLIIREDVVDGIAANLNGAFPEKHAIHARPQNGGYQILSGHHRVEAARKAGLETVAAWVEEMDDEAAFMELVLSNNQGELSPLEIGMHALKAVPKSDGGRGKKGGLSDYARKVGKAGPTITEWRQAAAVVEAVNPSVDRRVLLDRCTHLAAIHGAPTFDPPEDWDTSKPWIQPLWAVLVDLMLSRNWTVAETKNWVSKLAEFAIPEEWAGVFLEPVAVKTHFLESREFSPRTVATLAKQADLVIAVLEASSEEGVDTKAEAEAFMKWLADNAGPNGASWDARKIEAYRRELEERLKEKRIEAETFWNLGDFREHAQGLEDGTVSLLLTDPPYGIGFQSDHRLDRTKPRKHATITGDESTDAIRDMLAVMVPKLAENAHVLVFCHWRNEAEVRAIVEGAGLLVRGSLIWAKNNAGMGDPKTTFAPQHERIIHAVKGSPTLFDRCADVLAFDRCNSERHPTEKPVLLLGRLIGVTTVRGELVADPFGGVASTLVAAKQSERRYWGCEINPDYHATGAERLGAAQ